MRGEDIVHEFVEVIEGLVCPSYQAIHHPHDLVIVDSGLAVLEDDIGVAEEAVFDCTQLIFLLYFGVQSFVDLARRGLRVFLEQIR
jgi:hypothetical protein